MRRRHPMPFGAESLDDGKVRFRLWAPKAERVELCLASKNPLALSKLEDGWFELVTHAPAGSQYQYRINGQTRVPDPASRFQPSDVHGGLRLRVERLELPQGQDGLLEGPVEREVQERHGCGAQSSS